MASTIKRVGKRKPYPWDQWTDGKARRAVKGADFRCSSPGFAATLYSHANRHELNVKVSVPDKKTVEFQFSKR